MITTLKKTANRSFFIRLAAIALPSTAQMLLNTSRGLVDTIMIGRLGVDQVAAAGAATRPFFVAVMMIWAMASGAGILAAQYYGSKDMKGVRRSIMLSVVFGMAIALPISLLFIFAPAFVVGLAAKDPVIQAIGAPYLRIVGINLFFQVGLSAVYTGLRNINQAGRSTIFSVIGVGLNIALNYLLIFGKFGFPELGLKGAALATMISALVELILVFTYIYSTRHPLAFTKHIFTNALKKDDVVRFLKISLPMVLNGLIWSGGIYIYYIIYGRIGSEELAIMTILSPLESFGVSFFVGMANGAGVLVGQNLGSQNYKSAWNESWLILALNGIVTIALIAAIYFIQSPFFSLYVGFSDQILAMAKTAYLVLMGLLFFKGMNVVIIVGILRAGGDTRFVLFLDSFSQWAVGIPLGLLGAFVWKLPLPYVFALVSCEEVIKIFIAAGRVISKKWMRNLVSEQEAAA